MLFLASLWGSPVRVGVVGGEQGRGCGVSDSRGEVWIATEVNPGEYPPPSN